MQQPIQLKIKPETLTGIRFDGVNKRDCEAFTGWKMPGNPQIGDWFVKADSSDRPLQLTAEMAAFWLGDEEMAAASGAAGAQADRQAPQREPATQANPVVLTDPNSAQRNVTVHWTALTHVNPGSRRENTDRESAQWSAVVKGAPGELTESVERSDGRVSIPHKMLVSYNSGEGAFRIAQSSQGNFVSDILVSEAVFESVLALMSPESAEKPAGGQGAAGSEGAGKESDPAAGASQSQEARFAAAEEAGTAGAGGADGQPAGA